jgi:hypothetical protein
MLFLMFLFAGILTLAIVWEEERRLKMNSERVKVLMNSGFVGCFYVGKRNIEWRGWYDFG